MIGTNKLAFSSLGVGAFCVGFLGNGIVGIYYEERKNNELNLLGTCHSGYFDSRLYSSTCRPQWFLLVI